MIKEIICDNEDNSNYCRLPEDRKLEYQKIHKQLNCCPEEYIISVDVASPDSKDMSCVVYYEVDERGKPILDEDGKQIITGIKYF